MPHQGIPAIPDPSRPRLGVAGPTSPCLPHHASADRATAHHGVAYHACHTGPWRTPPCRSLPCLPRRAKAWPTMPYQATPAAPCQSHQAQPGSGQPHLPRHARADRSKPCPATPAEPHQGLHCPALPRLPRRTLACRCSPEPTMPYRAQPRPRSCQRFLRAAFFGVLSRTRNCPYCPVLDFLLNGRHSPTPHSYPARFTRLNTLSSGIRS
jgi:hypothetical protein